MTKVLNTKNEGWGFYGTTKMEYPEDQTDKRWEEAFNILLKLSNLAPEVIRRFLDSKYGRHLADACYKNDVEQVIKEWWKKGWIPKEISLKDYKKSDKEFYN